MGLPVLGALLTPTPQPPSISGVVQTSSQDSGTSFAPVIPAHIAGNVLLVFVSYSNSLGAADVTVSAGWTEEAQNSHTLRGIALFTKTATAAGHTITITNSNNLGITAHAYVLQGAQGDVDATVVAGGAPPSHTNGWGSIGNLWFAACIVGSGSVPTGFGDVTTSGSTPGSDGADLTTCLKVDDAATLNPSAFSAGAAGDESITACARPI